MPSAGILLAIRRRSFARAASSYSKGRKTCRASGTAVKALDTKKVENELLFLPTYVTSGIAPSDDPIINTRTEAYAESFGRRIK
jgi:hypothetical protein